MCKGIEYPFYLYFLSVTVREVSDIGEQIHLIAYYFIPRLMIAHNLINLFKESIIFDFLRQDMPQ